MQGLFIRVSVVSIFFVGFSNASSPLKTGRADEPTRIANKIFSVEVAKGWHFVDRGPTELKPLVWENKKVLRSAMGEILATPTQETDKSPVFISVHYVTPARRPPKEVTTTTESWQGREWTLAQYASRTSSDGEKNRQEVAFYLATTPYENGVIEVLASAPRDQMDAYRSTFLKMMESVKVAH